MNSQGSRVDKHTHPQKVQMQNILFTKVQTRFGGEVYSSDVIVHKGYSEKKRERRKKKKEMSSLERTYHIYSNKRLTSN